MNFLNTCIAVVLGNVVFILGVIALEAVYDHTKKKKKKGVL